MFAQDSIDLLNRSGIQFKRHEDEGIDVQDFAELLIPSGLILVDAHFVSFHSLYDFGYLLKILTNRAMPNEEEVCTDNILTIIVQINQCLSVIS